MKWGQPYGCWCAMASLAAALSAAACDAQSDSGYDGEPLLLIAGSVESSEIDLEGPVVPVLAWYPAGEDPSDVPPSIFQEAEVTGEFPNRFSMRVFEPPPDGAVTDLPEGLGPSVATARILAVRPGVAWEFPSRDSEDDGEPVWPDWLRGVAEDYLVYYLEGPSEAEDAVARYFGKALGPGYHLVHVRERTAEEKQARLDCQDARSEQLQARAIETYNERNETDYEGDWALPEEALDEYDAIYDDLEREIEQCEPRTKLTVVEGGLARPVSIHMGTNLDWIEF